MNFKSIFVHKREKTEKMLSKRDIMLQLTEDKNPISFISNLHFIKMINAMQVLECLMCKYEWKRKLPST